MPQDQALRELFQQARPHFDDTALFMQRLNNRLNAVEYLKQHEEAQLRRYKLCIVAAFALGLVCGGALLALLLSTPTDTPLFTFHAPTGILLLLQQHSRLIVTLSLSLLLCIGTVSITANLLDLLNLKPQVKG